MIHFNNGWYLLYVRPNFERKVAEFFDENRIINLLPTAKVIKEWKDRRKTVEIPLFPSYIFVYLNDHQQYFKVFEGKGVMHYIKCGKEIVKINESVISGLRSIVSNKCDIEVSSNRFKTGEQVLIQDGAFNGLTCEVIRYNGNNKVLIRLDILNRNVLVDLPSKALHTVN